MNKKGFSLLEILVTLALASLVVGLSVVSTRKATKNTNLSELKKSAKVFAGQFRNCVFVSGGWKLCNHSSGTCDDDDTDTTNNSIQACDPCTGETSCDGSNATTAKDKLKEKLNFKCPSDTECRFYTHTNDQHFCLDMRKVLHGNNYQMFVNIDTENTDNYQIYCKIENKKFVAVTSYTNLSDTDCKIPADEGDLPNGYKVCNF